MNADTCTIVLKVCAYTCTPQQVLVEAHMRLGKELIKITLYRKDIDES